MIICKERNNLKSTQELQANGIDFSKVEQLRNCQRYYNPCVFMCAVIHGIRVTIQKYLEGTLSKNE